MILVSVAQLYQRMLQKPFDSTRDEKGGWGKPNQTYANQPKSLKGSKVNETFHFLLT